jgi:hypothetical protein
MEYEYPYNEYILRKILMSLQRGIAIMRETAYQWFSDLTVDYNHQESFKKKSQASQYSGG